MEHSHYRRLGIPGPFKYLSLDVYRAECRRPILAMQDSKNVDPNCILLNNNSIVGCDGDFDSYAFSENRSVCSCNGLIGDLDRRDCFPSSGNTHGYYSSRAWAADSIYFRNIPGPYYKNDWHHIETYFEMNSIDAGIGIVDGKIRYWYDGQLLISSDSILSHRYPSRHEIQSTVLWPLYRCRLPCIADLVGG